MNSLTSGPAAALWVGLHILLLLVLSVRVVRLRRRHKVALGDGGHPDLSQAIRAFGNATEYAPVGLIGLVLLAQLGALPFAIHLGGLLLFAGRLTHAVGLSSSGGASLPRAAGMLISWIAFVFIAAVLLIYAVV
ncbi:MAPEG family protein [Caulobacter sp. NIBR2454]|uniref:MAPEG family protein n=1 Tax=Caulobacter sp. NIBR2454 TaxID=3015996 RepID=UPI0022B63A82|nr:MAPEG family protein [Caulobacter sp. NIBR2454]